MTNDAVHIDETLNRKTRAMVVQLKARVARRPGRWRRAMRGRRGRWGAQWGEPWDGQGGTKEPERLRAA